MNPSTAPRGAPGSLVARPSKRSAHTRGRIRDAAAHVLAKKGYAGLRIQDVAERAEVRVSAIYYYFASRDALVEEVLWFGMHSLRTHVAEALAGAEPDATGRQLLHLAIEAHLRLELEISDYGQAAMRNAGHVPPDVRRRNTEELIAYRELWRDVLARAVADGSLPARDRQDLVLRFALGALNWTAEWWVPGQGDVDELVRTAIVLVEHGLAGRPAEPQPLREIALPAEDGGTRGRILDAAAATLKDRGYATTYLADIAERADVQAPAIYHYFGSREELLQAAMIAGNRLVLEKARERIAEQPDNADARELLASAVAAHVEVALGLSSCAAAVIRNAGQAPEPLRSAITREAGSYQDVWRVLISQAAAQGRLRHGLHRGMARLLVHGALNWATEWWNPGIPVEEMVAAARTFVLEGLLVDDQP